MYKLMIVEDEPLIRAGLKVYFNWEAFGITTIIEAANGEEGIVQGLIHKPDLIITDIRMPELDGIQMIEQLRPRLVNSIFIILSGYEDFNYAQQAIRLGVSDYLIKPLQYEESETTISRCMEGLAARQYEQELLVNRNRWMEESQKWKHSRFMKAWLEHEQDMTEEEWLLQCEAHQIPTEGYAFLPIVWAFVPLLPQQHDSESAWLQTAERMIDQCLVLAQSPLHYHCYSYVTGSKVYMLLAVEQESSPDLASVNALLKPIDEYMNLLSSSSIYISIGTESTRLSEMKDAMRVADSTVYYRYFKPDQHVFSSSQYASMKGYPFSLSEDHKRMLIQSMEQADHPKIHDLMQRFAHDIEHQAHMATPEMMFTFIQEVIGICMRFVHTKGIAIEEIYSKKLYSFSFLDDFMSIADIFEWLSKFILQLSMSFQSIKQTHSGSEHQIFEQIEAFIMEHLDQEISLQMVADRFYYNPAYLSRLFKAKWQINFLHLLTDIRIRQAKEYLKQPKYHIAEIGEMCGYKSYKHFVKTFKKVTLVTPTDYRKSLGGIK